MTKADIVAEIAEKTGLEKVEIYSSLPNYSRPGFGP